MIAVRLRLPLVDGSCWPGSPTGSSARPRPSDARGVVAGDPGRGRLGRLRDPAGRSLVRRRQPQQRGPRPTAGDRLVFKMRIAPHWFDANDRFWYRNDLAGGAKEFILVDADARDAAAGLRPRRGWPPRSRRRPGKTYKADHLPFDEIELVRRREVRPLPGRRRAPGSARWTRTTARRRGTEDGTSARSAPRVSRRAEAIGPVASARARMHPGAVGELRSPDGKWTAFVKEHNVFVVAEGKPEEIRLSNDGKEGLSYGRLSWSPDSKTLVAFRIEPGDRKEVYLVQSSPPGGGRAQLRSRPYPLPGDKFTAYELNLFDVAGKKPIRPEVDRIDFDEPRLHWDKDGRHFSYEKIDRGHQRFRLIRVDSHTGEARNLIDEKSNTFIWTAHRENVRPADRHLARRVGRAHLRLRARRLAAPLPDRREDRRGQESRSPRASTSSAASTASTRRSARSGSAPAARTRIRTRTSSTTIASISTARAWSRSPRATATTRCSSRPTAAS